MPPSSPAGADARAQPARTVALVGQPNVGKSTLFNTLTGLNQHVGNWPGKTVALKQGSFDLPSGGAQVIDLPGTYTLTAASEEERVVRDYLLRAAPDVVIFIADATALERSLSLLGEVLALHDRVVVGLNRMDAARRHGISVDPQRLGRQLGLPVVPLIAREAYGLDVLLSSAEAAARNPGLCRPKPPEVRPGHAAVLDQIAAQLVPVAPARYPPRWLAQKLLEGDQEIDALVRAWLSADAWQQLCDDLHQHEDAVLDLLGARYDWVQQAIHVAVSRLDSQRASWTERLDRVATHGFWGLGLLLLVFAGVFAITFEIALPLQGWLDAQLVTTTAELARSSLAEAPAWLRDLIADGLVGGVGTVLTFLPILAIFYLVMALLEDTGYLARLAFVLDRFMNAFGLHGKSAMPLALGFGCNVISVVGARLMDSRSGRLLTILLAPLVPCSARLAVLAVLTPAFFGAWALPVAVGLVALNLAVLAGLGLLLNRALFRAEDSAFIMELPLYQRPHLPTTLAYVYANLKHFLQTAGTTIVVASLVVWALSSFPGPGIADSLLADLGRLAAPVGELMGLDWRLIAALLSTFVAKEVAISTLGILFDTAGQTAGLTSVLPAAIGPASGLAFLAVLNLFVPCIATLGAIRQETGGWRWTGVSIAVLLVFSLAAGIAVYQGARLAGLAGLP
jgi:ferrous iron transport protein B